MRAYYNDHDPFAAAWLRALIAEGQIPQGDVDERSILDVRPADLAGYDQCHFFAGIGGWPFALRIAGVGNRRGVWTGSPPCQPFSAAGKGLAADDPRHLAPAFARLVGACRPDLLFGEQVASADVFGPSTKPSKRGAGGPPAWAWCDDLFVRLEAAHYACGAGDIPSAGVGAPHIRQRCFFGAVRMADADGRDSSSEWQQPGREHGQQPPNGGAGADRCGKRPSPLHGFWRDSDWLYCRDERWRPVEPGTFPLAHGLPARVGRLRGYGNAINPWAAAEFVTAFMGAAPILTATQIADSRTLFMRPA